MSHQRAHSDQLGEGKIIRFDGTHDNYLLLKKLNSTVSSQTIVYKAELYFPDDETNNKKNSVVLKMIPWSLRNEWQKMQSEYSRSYGAEDHSNVLGIKRWFITYKDGFCGLEIPYMDEGSLRYIVSTWFKNNGMPGDCIAVALRAALLGLSFIHSQGRVHKHFSAATIFVNGGNRNKNNNNNNTAIKLAFEASMYEVDHQEDSPGGSSLTLKEITKWAAAPEVYGRGDSSTNAGDVSYGSKADIWLVGITALELAYRCSLPLADREDLEALIKKITKKQKVPISFGKLKNVKLYLQKKLKAAFRIKMKSASASSKEKEEVMFSKDFEKMVAKCLAKKPEKRPTAHELLQTNFFKNGKDINHFMRILLSAKENLTEKKEEIRSNK